MKEILVTGANGYIGARLSNFLSQSGYEVTAHCFPNIPNDEKWKNSIKHFIVGDIRDESVIEEMALCNIDTLIHLISLDHNQSNLLPFNDVLSINVNPTGNLLKKFIEKGLRKFIYFSTFQVYGKSDKTLISEDDKPSPLNVYGLTHLLSEQICNYFHSQSKIDCVSVRISNSYGSPVFMDNNCWWLVINELCKEAFISQKIQLKSDGSPLRDFIHYSDLCRAIKILIDKDKKDENNIYNIASGHTLSILEIANKVRDIYKVLYKKELNIFSPDGNTINYTSSNINRMHFIIDNSKLKDLGFAPSVKLEDGIKDLFYFFENNYD